MMQQYPNLKITQLIFIDKIKTQSFKATYIILFILVFTDTGFKSLKVSFFCAEEMVRSDLDRATYQ